MSQRVTLGLVTLVFSVCCFVLAHYFGGNHTLQMIGMWDGGLAYGMLVPFSWNR